MRTSALFCLAQKKTSDSLKFMVCPHTDKGRRADVFYARPLVLFKIYPVINELNVSAFSRLLLKSVIIADDSKGVLNTNF